MPIEGEQTEDRQQTVTPASMQGKRTYAHQERLSVSPQFFPDRLTPVGFVMPISGRDPGNQLCQAILAAGGPHDDHAILAHAHVQRVAFPQAGSLNNPPGKAHCQAVSPLRKLTLVGNFHMYLQRTYNGNSRSSRSIPSERLRFMPFTLKPRSSNGPPSASGGGGYFFFRLLAAGLAVRSHHDTSP